MKNKSTSFIVPLVIYPFDVFVSMGQTDDEFVRAIKKVATNEMFTELLEDDITVKMRPNTQGRALMLASGQLVLRMKHMPKSPEQYGYLQHEIFHIVTFLMDRIGMRLEINISDEAYTYMIAYLTTEIYSRL